MTEKRFLELQFEYLKLKIKRLNNEDTDLFLIDWVRIYAQELREFYNFLDKEDHVEKD